MIFSYDWLQSFFNKKLPDPEELAKIITFHSFEVEEIKKVGDDFVFDIDVTPNRPDCFSHLGIARECAALLNTKLKKRETVLKEKRGKRITDLVMLKIENKEDCIRYSGRLVMGVKVKPSPLWIQKRLKACGVQPINNIVDITNYVMIETGQPLHAFDFDKIATIAGEKKKKAIIVRRAKRNEKIEALDNRTYELNKEILVIADGQGPIAIAGIKGGRRAEINNETRNIFIEAANFNPILIRKASQMLKLRTDASMRFEHGIDPNLSGEVVDYTAFLIQKFCGGNIAKGRIDFYPQKAVPKRIILSLEFVEKLLGIKIKEEKNKIGTVYNFVSESITVTKPFLGVRLLLNGSNTPEYVSLSNKSIRADVLWESNIPTRIIDGQIEVKIKGDVLDKFSILTSNNGFYRSIDNTIIWDKGSNRDLAVIEPGESGSMSFTLQSLPLVKSGVGAFQKPQIVIEVSAKGKRISDSNVPEEIVTSVSKKIKFESNLKLASRAVYYTGPFKNSGPLPPVAEKNTTYTIIWTVVNSSNNVTGAKVKTTLPAYVKWLGVVSPNNENITFNDAGGEIVWDVGDVESGTGVVSSPREVAFQVS